MLDRTGGWTMGIASWSTIVASAAIAASIGPPDASAADVSTGVGIPTVTFAAGGASLTRNLAVAIDDALFSIEASTPICAQATPFTSNMAPNAGALCARNGIEAPNWMGEHSASVILKLPQWHPDAPYVDMSLRTWRGETSRDPSPSTSHGFAAEAEIAQVVGRYRFNAGYSYPLAATDDWRVAWVGAAMQVTGATRIRLTYESAHEGATGARDNRYALRLTHALGEAMRLTVYMTHAPDDTERRWRAGAGLELTF